jgi:epoxyqueuosine reductase
MSHSSAENEKALRSNACIIENKIKEFVLTSPANHISFLNDYLIFDTPLVKFANGDDTIFNDYKTIIAPAHLTPREALAQSFNRNPQDLPVRLSVISWILPIVEETRKSNRNEAQIPSRLWSHTRWYGEKFNDELRRFVVETLTKMGNLATAPMQQPYFKINSNQKGPYSNWSERHIAYVAGQGTFGLSDGFITEAGIAHRCGSVVTDLTLPVSIRTAKSPYSNCLFHSGVDCKVCAGRCPVGAITEKGHDKIKCQKYLANIGYTPEQLQKGYDNNLSTIGCGLCQTKVPCEFKNPAKNLKS